MRMLLTMALALFACGRIPAATIMFEDFESIGSSRTGVIYTPSVADSLLDLRANDYLGVVNLSSANAATLNSNMNYSNVQGTDFYAVQDMNGALPNAPSVLTLDWTNVNIAGFTGLRLSWFVGEDSSDDGNEDWDAGDAFFIETQIDGRGFNKIFAIESSDDGLGQAGSQTNEAPLIDTDFDGVGDGLAITDVLTQFDATLGTGTVLDIRATFKGLNAQDEDLAIDNILLQGYPIQTAKVAEPSITSLLAVGILFGLGNRQRRYKEQAGENACFAAHGRSS